jgi:hypothetical protein
MYVHGPSMLTMYSCVVMDEKHDMETRKMLNIILKELKDKILPIFYTGYNFCRT